MSAPLRPLSTSELLDRTFFLYRNNFVVFAGIAAIADLPILALRLGNSARKKTLANQQVFLYIQSVLK